MATADKVTVELEAKRGKFDRDIEGARSKFQSEMRKISGSADQAEREIRASSGQIAASFRNVAASLAAGASVAAVTRLADSYTLLQNRLKVTGLEGDALASQYERLNQVATDSRSGIRETVEVYARLRLATEGIGLSNADVTRTTEILAKSLAASGASASESAAALLQFSQAIGSGVLQGDELRSIRENAPAVARAIAKEFDVTVGGLKKLGEEGLLTSDRVIKAVLASGDTIDALFDRTQATVGNALTNIQNKLVNYIGAQDKAFGASAKVAGAINMLADNIGVIVPSLAILATGLGVGFVTNAIAATIAANGVTGSMVRMRGAILGAFGGPVGLAITGVAIAIATFASEVSDADADLRALTQAVNDADDVMDKFRPKADDGATAVKQLGGEAVVAEVKVRSFAGAVGEAAQKLYDLAKARQAAALAELNERRVAVSLGVSDAQQRTRAGRRSAFKDELTGKAAVTIQEQFNRGIRFFTGEIRDFLTGGQFSDQQEEAVRSGTESLRKLDAAILQAEANLEGFAKAIADEGSSSAATGPSGGGAGRIAAASDSTARELDRLRNEFSSLTYSLLSDTEKAAVDLAEKVDIIRRAIEAGLISAQQGARIEGAVAAQGLTLPELDEIFPVDDYAERYARLIREGEDARQREFDEQGQRLATSFVDILRSRNIGEEIGYRFRDAAFNNLEQLFSKLFSSALSSDGGIFGSLLKSIPGFANGTRSAPGGLAFVGERGPELVNLPRGSQVIPNHQLRGFGANQQPVVKLVVEESAYFAPRVSSIAGPIAVQASTVGVMYNADQAGNANKRRGQSFIG